MQGLAPGVFEFIASPGKYELRYPGGSNGPGQNSEVEISQDNQELDLSSGQAVGRVSTKVEILGETAAPKQMMFALRNSQHRIVDSETMSSTGEVTFADLAPGNYEILAGGASRAYSVISMVVNGSRISGHSLNVPAGANLAVSLTVVGGAAEVSGLAQRAGKGLGGAMIVLVPKNPEANRELFRRDQSDLDGSFTFHTVIPGAYTVIAIENGWDLDWSKPAVIARYAVHSRKLVVGSQSVVELPGPIEIQPK